MKFTAFLMTIALLSACGSGFNLNRANGVRGPLAPRAVTNGMFFQVKAPAATQVMIAGDFNGWSPLSTPMLKDADGVWSIILPLTSGRRYLYMFVIDNYWVADPDNPVTEPTKQGGVRSVITVP